MEIRNPGSHVRVNALAARLLKILARRGTECPAL